MTAHRCLAAALLGVLLLLPLRASAQVAVVAAKDQQALLASADAKLAANKKLVYDFWRSVLEGGHLEQADRYLAESYIQHNPMVPTGRAGFVTFFSAFAKPRPIEERVRAPLVAITAERDLVVLAFVQELPDPKDPAQHYTTTAFDMFRIEDGRIAEHWDSETRR